MIVRSSVGLVFCRVMIEMLLTVRTGVISYFVRYEEYFSGLILLDRNHNEGRFTAIRLRPASSTVIYIALVLVTVLKVST